MPLARASLFVLLAVVLAHAGVAVRAAGPMTGGGLITPQAPETLKLAPFYVGDDGGAYYVREHEGQVYWFAEHPGRNYAHVFKGERHGDRIRGRFISVPKGSVTAAGNLQLRIRNDAAIEVIGVGVGFVPKVLRPHALAQVLDQLPGATRPRFGTPVRVDLDGGFVDEIGRIYYFRQVGTTLAFAAESRSPGRAQPQGVFVFMSERRGNTVSGELVAVPKGTRTLTAQMRLVARGDGMVDATSDSPLFQNLRLRAMTPIRTLRLLRAPGPVEVVTQFDDGLEVLGDIVVSAPSNTFRSAVVAGPGSLWPDGLIPYDDSAMSTSQKNAIQGGIADFDAKTNIRFVRRTDQRDFVRFTPKDQIFGCTSCGRGHHGRIKGGGPQPLYLTPNVDSSTVIHELGHAAGLFHEHERFDRDQFIEVLWDNIVEDSKVNFQKFVTREMDYGPYDYHSVMHYGEYILGIPTGPNTTKQSIRAKTPGQYPLGNNRLSPGDVRGLEHLYAPLIHVPGVGHRGNGAGIAVTRLGGNTVPDIILMAYDDAEGQNSFTYRIAFDVDDRGVGARVSDPIKIDGLGHRGDGAGIAIADIDRNGRPDMVLLAYDSGDGQNSFKYKVCRDLNSGGVPASCGPRQLLPGLGHEGDGAGVVVGDVDGDGDLDLIAMAYDDAAGNANNSFKYWVARDLKIDGSVGSVSGPVNVPGLGERGDGADVLMLNFMGNNRPELMLMAYDDAEGQNSFKLLILQDVSNAGVSAQITRQQYQGFGHHGDGAGMVAADLDGNGIQDLILMAYDAAEGPNTFKYRVLRDALQP